MAVANNLTAKIVFSGTNAMRAQTFRCRDLILNSMIGDNMEGNIYLESFNGERLRKALWRKSLPTIEVQELFMVPGSKKKPMARQITLHEVVRDSVSWRIEPRGHTALFSFMAKRGEFSQLYKQADFHHVPPEGEYADAD